MPWIPSRSQSSAFYLSRTFTKTLFEFSVLWESWYSKNSKKYSKCWLNLASNYLSSTLPASSFCKGLNSTEERRSEDSSIFEEFFEFFTRYEASNLSQTIFSLRSYTFEFSLRSKIETQGNFGKFDHSDHILGRILPLLGLQITRVLHRLNKETVTN